MNIPRIVVLTTALRDGGIAAYRADGSGDTPLPTDSINTVRDGVLSLIATQK
jgi:hypothetical protein